MHRVTAITKQIELQFSENSAFTVLKNSAANNRKFPAILIKNGGDIEQDFNPKYQDMALTLNLMLVDRLKSKDDLDESILELRRLAHIALFETHNLGKSYVNNVRIVEQSPPDFDEEGDVPQGSCELSLEILYESPLYNPSEE